MTQVSQSGTPDAVTSNEGEVMRELKVDAEPLVDEVAWMSKMPPAVSKETAVIQVTAVLGALVLRRANSTQYRESVIPTVGMAQADILVDADKLNTAMKTVSGPIVVSIGEDKLSIQSSGRTVRLAAADIEFPDWPQFEGRKEEQVAVSSVEATRVLTSIGTDDAFPQLMHVVFDNGTMVTTDKFRLSAIKCGDKGFTGGIPGSALRAFAGGEGIVRITPGQRKDGGDWGWAELTSGGRTLTTPMSQEPLLQWKRLIPEKTAIRVMLRRDDLLKAAEGEETTLIIFEDSVTAISDNDGVEVEQDLKMLEMVHNTLDGPFTVSVRSKYIKECVRAISSGVVLLEATAPDKPLLFRDVGEDDLHLIMPVRKKAEVG